MNEDIFLVVYKSVMTISWAHYSVAVMVVLMLAYKVPILRSILEILDDKIRKIGKKK